MKIDFELLDRFLEANPDARAAYDYRMNQLNDDIKQHKHIVENQENEYRAILSDHNAKIDKNEKTIQALGEKLMTKAIHRRQRVPQHCSYSHTPVLPTSGFV